MAIYFLCANLFIYLIFITYHLLLKILQKKVDEKSNFKRKIYFISTTYAIIIFFICYNIINIFLIKENKISVPIKNLPKEWKNKKIIHLSDLHLGDIWGKGFLKKIVKKTNYLNPDLIVITGDLFDGMPEVFNVFTDDLKKFKAKHGVLFISGNHELYSGLEEVKKIIKKSNIKMMDNKVININGLKIIGMGFSKKGKNNNNFDFLNLHKKDSHILLSHVPEDVFSNKKFSYFNPKIDFNNIVNTNISLQLSGHTHAGQFIPFTWVTKKIYNGFHYGLHKIKDFYIYINSGTGLWGIPFRSGSSSEITIIQLK